MLKDYFINPRTLFRMRLGPIGPFMDEIANELQEKQYARGTARALLRGMSHFSKYMLWKKVERIESVTMDDINDFLKNHLPVCNCERPNSFDFSGERFAMDCLRKFLVSKGFMAKRLAVFSPDSLEGILIRYMEYLKDIQSLSEKSRCVHSLAIRRLLNMRLRLNNNALELERIKPKDVLDILGVLLVRHGSLDWKSNITSCTRCFLRFLHWERIISEDLGHFVPSIMRWKLQSIPGSLTSKQIETLLNTPDRSTPVGVRDYAILVLLATLGVRASEIVLLKLDDIHWKRKTLTVPARKTVREREMPLSDIALHALYEYIRNVRQKQEARQVFLKIIAPVKPLASSSTVTSLVREYVIRSGIQVSGPIGPHRLRHALATQLINNGAHLKEVADLLGHLQVNTTRIYEKVDMESLRKVVTPFPDIKLGR